MRVKRNPEVYREEIRRDLQKCFDFLGYTPTRTEYEILREQLGLSRQGHAIIDSTGSPFFRRKFIEVTEALGFPAPPTGNKAHYLKMKSFGIPFTYEITITVQGHKYRIDYMLEHPEFGLVYVEIDGSSHLSVRSIYHNFKHQKLTPEESFKKKQESDKLKEEYIHSKGSILIRINYHQFLRLNSQSFEDLLRKKIPQGSSFNVRFDPVDEKTVRELLSMGMPQSQIAKILNVSEGKINKFCGKHNIRSKLSTSEINKNIKEGCYNSVILECFKKGEFRAKKIVEISGLGKKIVYATIDLLCKKGEIPEEYKLFKGYKTKISKKGGVVSFEKENKESIKKWFEEGKTVEEISYILKVSVPFISLQCRKWGLKSQHNPQERTKKINSGSFDSLVLKIIKKGGLIKDMQKESGLGSTAFRRVLKRLRDQKLISPYKFVLKKVFMPPLRGVL